MGGAEVECIADAFEDIGHGEADLGEDLIDDAGNEERNSGGHV